MVQRQPSVQREAVVQRQPPVQGPGAVSTQGRRSKGWCACRGGGSVSSSQLFSEIGGRGQRACSREAESRRGWAGGVSRIHHAGQSCRVRRTIAGSSRAPHPHVVPARPKTDKLQVTPAPPPTRMPIHLICNKRQLLPRVGVDNLEQCVARPPMPSPLAFIIMCAAGFG